MKVKTKLIASIMSICLVCAVFAIGVFALKTANLKIGGDVSFSATGVEADIKNVTLTGATTNDQVLATGSINTSMTQADIDTTFQNWQTLELDFDEEATDIELKFDIANTSTNADNYIEIGYSYSFSNANPNVDVFPGDENAQSVWENNEYILAPKGSAETATYETFTLKFKVLNKELNVPQDTKVSVNIELKHVTPKSAAATDNVVTIDNVEYTLNESKGTATVTGHTITTSGYSAVIHPVVMSDAEGAVPCVVTTIGNSAFFTCSNLTTITIPSSVTSIGKWAFFNTPWYNNQPDGLIYINNVLYDYKGTMPAGTTSIEVKEGTVSISDSAFEYCNDLTTITIPSSVTSIGDSAFSGCFDLTSITIPSSVTSIGSSAFSGTPWYNNQPDGLIYINNVLYDYKGTMPAGTTSIEVKEGTVSISGYAFSGCSGLTTITIPSSVTSIGSYAFSGCSGLTTITIPSSVTSIGSYAFYGCTNLTSITIPSSVTSIGSYAFDGCSKLTSAKFEETTGWFKAASADATEGENVTVTSDFTEDNANVLKNIAYNQYLLRKDA